jgi:hypothetical protein
LPRRLDRFGGALGKVAAIRASTALRGIMCVERAKAMTFSKREPGSGGGNVSIVRGSIGPPCRMSFAQA